MRTRTTIPLAVAVVVLIVLGTTVAVTHHVPFGLHRSTGAPRVPPVATEPASPPAAAAGPVAARPAQQPVARRAVRAPSAGQTRASAGPSPSGAKVYPGPVSCPDANAPASTPYAWECTHADGTPVRWATRTISFWAEGLTAAQSSALQAATAQWTPHTGIALAPAPSSAAAQLVLTEVSSLDALPDLGPDIVEYAVTEVHQTGGYYDHATVQVANVAALGSDAWLDTMLHELGHVAGLTHVMAQNQIMRRVVGVPQTSYGDGDVAGLESERPR